MYITEMQPWIAILIAVSFSDVYSEL